jgi:hypothetical protein
MRLLLLVAFVAPLVASTCGGGGVSGPPSWETYADLVASTAALPVQLVVGPGLTLADAQAQANAVGCGVEIRLSGTVTGNLVLSPRCPDPNQLGIRVRGPATLLGGIRVSCLGTDCAWASLEQLSVSTSLDDAFDVDGDARMAVIAGTGSVSGAYSNVLTAHDRSWLLALNTSGSASGTELAPPVAIIQSASVTAIGRGTFNSASAASDEVVSLGGSSGGTVHATLIGHRLVCGTTTSQASIDFNPGTNGTVFLDSGVLEYACPVEAMLTRSGERVVWRMLRDRLPALSLASPMAAGSDFDVEIDSARGVMIGLAVPIPAWVDGTGVAALRVAD